MINIDELEYCILYGSSNLTLYAQEYNPSVIGLSQNFLDAVCPESDEALINCIETSADDHIKDVYDHILSYITNLCPNSYDSLKELLGKHLI